MAKPELGTKRICPETGRKFYDLNKDPVVSPYTGKSYPRSYFDDVASEIIEAKMEKASAVVEDDEEEVELEGPEVLSLDDAEEEATASPEALPDLGDNTDDEIIEDEDDADDTFLPDDEEDGDDDMVGIVDIAGGDDED